MLEWLIGQWLHSQRTAAVAHHMFLDDTGNLATNVRCCQKLQRWQTCRYPGHLPICAASSGSSPEPQQASFALSKKALLGPGCSLCSTLLPSNAAAIPVFNSFSNPGMAERTSNWSLEPSDLRRVPNRDSMGSLQNFLLITGLLPHYCGVRNETTMY